MEVELWLRIVLVTPPAGVDFGVQDGKGNDYKTIQKQRSKGADLNFEFKVTVKDNRDDGIPNFLGSHNAESIRQSREGLLQHSRSHIQEAKLTLIWYLRNLKERRDQIPPWMEKRADAVAGFTRRTSSE